MNIVHTPGCTEKDADHLCPCIMKYCERLREDYDKLEERMTATQDEAMDIIRKSKDIQILDKKDFEKFNKAVMERMVRK